MVSSKEVARWHGGSASSLSMAAAASLLPNSAVTSSLAVPAAAEGDDDDEKPVAKNAGPARASKLQLPEPALGDYKLYLDAVGHLHWPVFFAYPESQQSDLIGDWDEEDTFRDQLAVVFDPNGPLAPWDPARRYRPDTVEVYFEAVRADGTIGLAKVGPSLTLRKVLTHPQYTVVDRVPSFIVLSRASDKFYQHFLAQYKAPS